MNLLKENAVSQNFDLNTRARKSLGSSSQPIYLMVKRALEQRRVSPGTLVDVGCGGGHLRGFVQSQCMRYVGVDAVRYSEFPSDVEFHSVDLDNGRIDLPDGSADVVTAVEVIEHLENPRSFVRELVRVVKPGGAVLVTTPNQLSLLSLFTLCVKGRFSAFQDSDYPAHLTALLEIDLKRIFAEAGLTNVKIAYSGSGRVIFTSRHYPEILPYMFPRIASDNILVIGTRTRQ